jgi:hypothetical protein
VRRRSRPGAGPGGGCAGEAGRRAQSGWSVVPLHSVTGGRCTCSRPDCPSPGKHPRVRWTGAMTAPAPPEDVAGWWRRWPGANLGVATGRVSGVLVLDVDPRSGGETALGELEARWGSLPATVESRTGGGGRHLYFAASADPVPSAVLAPGVELKGEGGLAVLPPSRHASGRRYEWLPGRSPEELAPAPLPGWVAALAHGLEPGPPGRPAGDPPVRTERERAEFAQAWRRAGVEIGAGDRYYRCPFHDDEHPSLHVDAEGCRWYCFGCRLGGGLARLLELLGDPRPRRPRARRRGRVGAARPVTLAGATPVEIVDEALHQDELLELAGGQRPYGGVELAAVAELIPDAEDPGLIRVAIEGQAVGRLRREDAELRRTAVERARADHGAATCRAVVRGGWDRGRGDVGLFGVVLLLP